MAISAYPDLFQMLATNFVSNAIKYCDKGSITINSWIEIGNVVMSITNTVIGMSKGDLSRLLQAYTRVSDSNSTNRQGTGLGLTLSLRIAQLHHGDIKAESEKAQLFRSLGLCLKANCLNLSGLFWWVYQVLFGGLSS